MTDDAQLELVKLPSGIESEAIALLADLLNGRCRTPVGPGAFYDAARERGWSEEKIEELRRFWRSGTKG